MAALASTRKNFSTDDEGSGVPRTTTSRPVRGDSEGVPGEKKTQSKILLKQISSSMKTFKAQWTYAKPTLELIEKLGRILSEMENSITNLQEEQQSCLADCVKEQRKHTDSISISENQDLSKLTSEKTGPSHRNLPAEVIALDVFLQNSGGACGGWDQSDHRVFMRIWMKHRGKSSYREEVLQYLPGKRLKEVKQHEEWHQDLLSLKDQKKEAIQRWKANKAEEQRQKLKAAQRREEEAEQRRIRNNNVWYQRLKDFRERLAREEEKIKQEEDTKNQLDNLESLIEPDPSFSLLDYFP